VSETDAFVGRHPMTLPIGTPMEETARRALQLSFADWLASREDSNDSAHSPYSTSGPSPSSGLNDILARSTDCSHCWGKLSPFVRRDVTMLLASSKHVVFSAVELPYSNLREVTQVVTRVANRANAIHSWDR
jgi:hypothetical protein